MSFDLPLSVNNPLGSYLKDKIILEMEEKVEAPRDSYVRAGLFDLSTINLDSFIQRVNSKEFLISAAEIACRLGLAVFISYYTGRMGAWATRALLAAGIHSGTASIVSTTATMLGGGPLGGLAYSSFYAIKQMAMGHNVDGSELKKQFFMGNVDGAMAAFGPAAARGLVHTLTGKRFLSFVERYRVGFGVSVVDGMLSGGFIEGTHSVLDQVYDTEHHDVSLVNWDEVAKRAALGIVMGGFFGWGMYAVLRRLENKFSFLKSEGSTQSSIVSQEPLTLEQAKERILSYQPDATRSREVRGQIYIVPAEGRRAIPSKLSEDAEFTRLHSVNSGGGGFHDRLPYHRVLEVLNFLGIRLIKEGADLSSVSHLEVGTEAYAQKVRESLLEELDDELIKKVLRFFGVNCHAEEGWAQQVRWARAGWKNNANIMTDVDDTVVDSWNTHPVETFPTVIPFKAVTAVLHYSTPFDIGGIHFMAQARPQAYEIFKVLRTGETIPVNTDDFKWMLDNVYRLFPSLRFVHTFKLPYQNVNYADVYENPMLRTVDEQAASLETLRDLLRNTGWKQLSDDLKRAVAFAVFHPKGHKAKNRGLIDLLNRNNPSMQELLKRLKESTLIDNAPRNATDGWGHLGGRAVEVQDRKMSAFGGNYLTPDTGGGLRALFRELGWVKATRGVDKVISFLGVGRLNRLPAARYGMWDYIHPALEKLTDGTIRVERFNSTATTGGERLLEFFWRAFPKNGLEPGAEVQRGTIYTPWRILRNEFEALKKVCKGRIQEMEEFLHIERVDGEGETAFEQARRLWEVIKNEELSMATHPDLPLSSTE